MLVVSPRETALNQALCESAGLLAEAEAREALAAGAWVVPDAKVIVLGRMQHARRVLAGAQPAGWQVARRVTTGTAVALDGGLLVSVALPAIDSVFRDATVRTVLNRNVRLFLAGLRSAGVPAAYFGREWLAWQRRPLAVCGLEMTPSGALLLEAFFSMRGSLALPREVTTDVERSVERYAGKPPASLEEAAGGRGAGALASAILAGIVERAGLDPLDHQPIASSIDTDVVTLESPLPSGSKALPPRQVPIGWLDLALTPGGMWVGGDALAPSYALGLGAPPPDGAPMEGASWVDVQRARDTAR
jgi:hypothetical protein